MRPQTNTLTLLAAFLALATSAPIPFPDTTALSILVDPSPSPIEEEYAPASPHPNIFKFRSKFGSKSKRSYDPSDPWYEKVAEKTGELEGQPSLDLPVEKSRFPSHVSKFLIYALVALGVIVAFSYYDDKSHPNPPLPKPKFVLVPAK